MALWVQSIRFDRIKLTVAQAKAWLKDKGPKFKKSFDANIKKWMDRLNNWLWK